MKRNSLRQSGCATFLVIAASLLGGCAEEGGSVADNGGMSGTGISQGAISSFGSIFVNDVAWSTDTATITVDGQPANEADLRVGMVVRVRGNRDASNLTGSAVEVDFDAALVGPVDAAPVQTIPNVEERFDVLGRTVVATEGETVYAGGVDFGSIAQNDVVEISGFEGPGGLLEATRIERIGAFPAVNRAESEGEVANLVPGAGSGGSFELRGVLVRFDVMTRFVGTDAASLMNGDEVDVEGTVPVAGNEIEATEIALVAPGLGVDDAEEVDLGGIISDFVSLSSFRVEDVPVDASSAVLDPPGAVFTDGDEVEVEGDLVMGVLVATRVELEDLEDDEEEIEIVGELAAIDPTLRTITVLGLTLSVDPGVQFEDETGVEENFGFDDLVAGDWLEIEGGVDSLGAIEVSSIVREDPDDDVSIFGPAEALDRATPAFDVLGLGVPLTPTTSYFDENDLSLSEAVFFGPPGAIDEGSLVEIVDEDAVDPRFLLEADIVDVDVR